MDEAETVMFKEPRSKNDKNEETGEYKPKKEGV